METIKQSEDFSEFLSQEFAKRQNKNSKYSLRAFANHLNMDPSNLSKVLRGQKKLSNEKIWDLGLNLNIEPDQIYSFIGYSSRKFVQPIDKDKFKDTNHWLFDAVLNLNAIPKYNGKVSAIAMKLNIGESFCQEIFDKLLESDLLRLDPETGIYFEETPDNTIGINEPTNEDLQLYQERILQKSMESIRSIGLDRREHFAFVTKMNNKHKKQFEKIIAKFRKDLLNLIYECDEDDPNDVFAIQMGFFPLTNEGDYSETHSND